MIRVTFYVPKILLDGTIPGAELTVDVTTETKKYGSFAIPIDTSAPNIPVPTVNPSTSSIKLAMGDIQSISFTVANKGGPTSADAYLTISVSDKLEIVKGEYTSDNGQDKEMVFVHTYPGELIYYKDGKQYPSQYEVLDAAQQYNTGESHVVTVKIQRKSAGEAWIYYRATFDDAVPGINYINNPATSKHLDGQNWPVFKIPVNGGAPPSRPIVESTIPQPNKDKVLTKSVIKVFFSKNMDPDSTKKAYSISPDVAGSLYLSNNVLWFQPTLHLREGQKHTVTIASTASDTKGNTLLEPYTWSFTTEPYTPPSVVIEEVWLELSGKRVQDTVECPSAIRIFGKCKNVTQNENWSFKMEFHVRVYDKYGNEAKEERINVVKINTLGPGDSSTQTADYSIIDAGLHEFWVELEGFQTEDMGITIMANGLIADFGYTVDGKTVRFTDKSTGNPTSWHWDFGDGKSSIERNPVHTYISCGIYNATLEVTNQCGSGSTKYQILMLDMQVSLRSQGCTWVDYDNDDDLDLYVVNGGEPNQLFKNTNGTFELINDVIADSGGGAAAWVDYNNDGHLDLYIANPSGANRLYKNIGNGTFVELAESLGIANAGSSSVGAAWSDYDNDGDIDLYVANYRSPNRLYQNQGDGNFIDDAVNAGVAMSAESRSNAAVWGDYDNDGWLDLYVANDAFGGEPNALLHIGILIMSNVYGAEIHPVASSPQAPGKEFWVEVEVKDVSNLFGVSFVLSYNTVYLDVVDDIVQGDFLGSDVVFYPNVDEENGEIAVGISRKAPASGVDGTGVVAKVKFKSKVDMPAGTMVSFTIKDISANDPTGNSIDIAPEQLDVQIGEPPAKKYPPWDVNDDGKVDIFDLVLVGSHFGEVYRTESPVADKIGTPSGKETNVWMEVQNKVGVERFRLLVVNINVEPVLDLYGCQFDLAFDPKVLEVVGVKPGDMLAQDGASTYWNVSKIDNRMGRIGNAIYVRKATKKGISTGGTLATVVFKVKAVSISGSTRLNLTNLALADVDARMINAVVERTLLKWEKLLVPARSMLLQNYPNPFNPETWIPYQLSDDAEVTIHIYNVNGQMVKTLNLGYKQNGYYVNKRRAAYWDGRNELGEKVASGVYFYTIQAGRFVATRRMSVVK